MEEESLSTVDKGTSVATPSVGFSAAARFSFCGAVSAPPSPSPLLPAPSSPGGGMAWCAAGVVHRRRVFLAGVGAGAKGEGEILLFSASCHCFSGSSRALRSFLRSSLSHASVGRFVRKRKDAVCWPHWQ